MNGSDGAGTTGEIRRQLRGNGNGDMVLAKAVWWWQEP